ncbi:MAG TPA: hypothetical protein VFP79_11370 [Pseudolabrys sp.]|nr:hypothetical protein [Pseudolabrys sp.]
MHKAKLVFALAAFALFILPLGNFVLESVGQWQTIASVGDEPLKLLVVDVVEKG